MTLRLFEFDSEVFDKGCMAVLSEALGVKTVHEINGDYTLEFTYPPVSGKAELIRENRIAVCEGQAFRIIKTAFDPQKGISVFASHVSRVDAKTVHIQNIPDMMGIAPKDVIAYAAAGSQFRLLTAAELEKKGMKWVGDDGFLIDFFSSDKLNLLDAVENVRSCCGKGELYADNYSVALVERIGRDTGVRLGIGKNMASISVERDISDIVTRLYPYGKDDMHIGSVNGGVQYVDSENIGVYGVREGFKDYSEYTEPEKIMARAEWEMSADNPERIDVPKISVSGNVTDLGKLSEYGGLEKLEIGDGVLVEDRGSRIYERVIRIEEYPYEAEPSVITVGSVKKDLFFYLSQMGKLGASYKRVSTNAGKVRSDRIYGNVRVNGIRTDADGVSTFSGRLSVSALNGLAVEVRDGELYNGGKRVLLEEQ